MKQLEVIKAGGTVIDAVSSEDLASLVSQKERAEQQNMELATKLQHLSKLMLGTTGVDGSEPGRVREQSKAVHRRVTFGHYGERAKMKRRASAVCDGGGVSCVAPASFVSSRTAEAAGMGSSFGGLVQTFDAFQPLAVWEEAEDDDDDELKITEDDTNRLSSQSLSSSEIELREENERLERMVCDKETAIGALEKKLEVLVENNADSLQMKEDISRLTQESESKDHEMEEMEQEYGQLSRQMKSLRQQLEEAETENAVSAAKIEAIGEKDAQIVDLKARLQIQTSIAENASVKATQAAKNDEEVRERNCVVILES